MENRRKMKGKIVEGRTHKKYRKEIIKNEEENRRSK